MFNSLVRLTGGQTALIELAISASNPFRGRVDPAN